MYVLSFIDIFIQKSYQLKGVSRVITKKDIKFEAMEKELLKITLGKLPFSSIFRVTVTSVKPVIAPSYLLFPNTTEQDQIANAKKAYGIK